MEKWKKINGFENYYVSNYGRIYNNKTKNELTPYLDSKNRYYMIDLYNNSIRKKKLIHRLVAEHFVDNPLNKQEVNHKDHNEKNNCWENLEWVTRKENMEHCFEMYSPTRNYKECYLVKNNVIIGEFKSVIEACRYAHEHYGISQTSLDKYRKVKDFKILPKTQTTISQESTPEDKLLVEVPTTLAS